MCSVVSGCWCSSLFAACLVAGCAPCVLRDFTSQWLAWPLVCKHLGNPTCPTAYSVKRIKNIEKSYRSHRSHRVATSCISVTFKTSTLSLGTWGGTRAHKNTQNELQPLPPELQSLLHQAACDNVLALEAVAWGPQFLCMLAQLLALSSA